MNSNLNWDEFRLVKAIAQARSLVGAADALGLNHSTIFRRLAAIETAVGARLFERSRAGYQATAAGEEMVELAGRMGESITEFERRVAGRDVKPTGELRVTTVDTFAMHLLPPILGRFLRINPAVQIEMVLAQQFLNLSRRDADVAIRATSKPPETLVGRRICPIRWGVYATQELIDEWGKHLVDRAPWVAFVEPFSPPHARKWVETHIAPRRQIFRENSVMGMAAAAAGGIGAALLPCFLGERTTGLARAGAPLPELDIDLWILTHADLRYSARVRAFMDYVGNELAKLRPLIENAADPAPLTALETAP